MAGACKSYDDVDFGAPDGSGNAEAGTDECKAPKLECGPDKNCIDVQSSNDNCGSCDNKCDGTKGLACSQGTCQCGTGKTECNGECTDTDSDPKNCGSCSNACASGEVCNAGKCDPVGCGTGLTDCSGQCVDTDSDEANCGTCANTCPTGQFCTGGKCDCPTGQEDCNGTCTDTQTNSANCGTCGNACDAGENCINGVCAGTACVLPNKLCSGSCVPLQSDNANCGDCDIVCNGAAGFSCQAGLCACATGQIDCNGTCTNTLTDPANCGTGAAACGNACDTAANEVCNNGVCEAQCGTGLEDCGGSCVNWQDDEANCGSCGNACAASETCNAGVCECPSGTTLCGTECVDVLTDEDNCGACANDCAAQSFCKADGIGGASCVAAEVKILTVSCPTTVVTGQEIDCTAMATLEDTAGTVDLTNDATVKWFTHIGKTTAKYHDNGASAWHTVATALQPNEITCADQDNAPLADEDCGGGNGNAGPGSLNIAAFPNATTKGKIQIDDESCFTWSNPNACQGVYVRAVYTKGLVTVVSNDLLLDVGPRALDSVSIYPQNPTVPYLYENVDRHLIINFVPLGHYNNGTIVPLRDCDTEPSRHADHRTCTGANVIDGTFSWNSNDDSVADITVADQPYEDGIVHLTDLSVHPFAPLTNSDLPSTLSAEIEVNFTPKGTTTNYNASTTLSIVSGCPQSLTLTATPDSIANGDTTVLDAVVAFGSGANSVNFSVNNLCGRSSVATSDLNPATSTMWRELRSSMAHTYTNWCYYEDYSETVPASDPATALSNDGYWNAAYPAVGDEYNLLYLGRSVSIRTAAGVESLLSDNDNASNTCDAQYGSASCGDYGQLNHKALADGMGGFQYRADSNNVGVETVNATFARPIGGGVNCTTAFGNNSATGSETVIITPATINGCVLSNDHTEFPSTAEANACTGPNMLCNTTDQNDEMPAGIQNRELSVLTWESTCTTADDEYCVNRSKDPGTVWTSSNSGMAAVQTPNQATNGQNFNFGTTTGPVTISASVLVDGETATCSATLDVVNKVPVCVTVVPAYRGTVGTIDNYGYTGSIRAFREWKTDLDPGQLSTGDGPTPAYNTATQENDRYNVLLPNLSAFSQPYRAFGWYSKQGETCNCTSDFDTECYAIELTNDPNTVWDTTGLGAGDTVAAVTVSATTKGLYDVNQHTMTSMSDNNVNRATRVRAAYTYNGTTRTCDSSPDGAIGDPGVWDCPQLNVCGTIHYGNSPPNGTWLTVLTGFGMHNEDYTSATTYNDQEDGALATYVGATTSDLFYAADCSDDSNQAGEDGVIWADFGTSGSNCPTPGYNALRYYATQVFVSEGYDVPNTALVGESCTVMYDAGATNNLYSQNHYRLDVSEETTNCQALHPTLAQASSVASVSNTVNERMNITAIADGVENGDARIRCDYASSSSEELIHVNADRLRSCTISATPNAMTRIGSTQKADWELNLYSQADIKVTGLTENGLTVDLTPAGGPIGYSCTNSGGTVKCMGVTRGATTDGTLNFSTTQGNAPSLGDGQNGCTGNCYDDGDSDTTAEGTPDCFRGSDDEDGLGFKAPGPTVDPELNMIFSMFNANCNPAGNTYPDDVNIEGVAVVCNNCGDPNKGYTTGTGDVYCTWTDPADSKVYEEIRIKTTNRLPTGVFIQTGDKSCFDAPAPDMRMLETSVMDFYACITYADGTVEATDRIDGDDPNTFANWTGTGIWDATDGGYLNNHTGLVLIENGVSGSSSVLKVEYLTFEDTITITAYDVAFASIAIVGRNVIGATDPTGCSAIVTTMAAKEANVRSPNVCELAGTEADWRIVGTWPDAVTQDITDNVAEVISPDIANIGVWNGWNLSVQAVDGVGTGVGVDFVTDFADDANPWGALYPGTLSDGVTLQNDDSWPVTPDLHLASDFEDDLTDRANGGPMTIDPTGPFNTLAVATAEVNPDGAIIGTMDNSIACSGTNFPPSCSGWGNATMWRFNIQVPREDEGGDNTDDGDATDSKLSGAHDIFVHLRETLVNYGTINRSRVPFQAGVGAANFRLAVFTEDQRDFEITAPTVAVGGKARVIGLLEVDFYDQFGGTEDAVDVRQLTFDVSGNMDMDLDGHLAPIKEAIADRHIAQVVDTFNGTLSQTGANANRQGNERLFNSWVLGLAPGSGLVGAIYTSAGDKDTGARSDTDDDTLTVQ
jgi:hypothetical protein